MLLLVEGLPKVAQVPAFTEAWSWLHKSDKIKVLNMLRSLSVGGHGHLVVPKIGSLFSSAPTRVESSSYEVGYTRDVKYADL